MSDCPKCAGVGFRRHQCPNCKTGPWYKSEVTMRIQTIHRNPMGDVLNECSAQGFRISDAEGNSITVTIEGDQINIEGDPFVTGYYDGRLRALRMVPGGISGKKPTGVIIDDPVTPKHICYECGKPTKWLADDSRCSRCTRLTPDEIIGGS